MYQPMHVARKVFISLIHSIWIMTKNHTYLGGGISLIEKDDGLGPADPLHQGLANPSTSCMGKCTSQFVTEALAYARPFTKKNRVAFILTTDTSITKM